MKPSLFTIDLNLGETRIFRQVTFDLQTFNALMDMKRSLNTHHKTQITNSELLRAVILSQPDLSAFTTV